MRYVIEPSIASDPRTGVREWIVAVDRGDVMDIVHFGPAVDCIAWCEQQGAERRGPRLYVSAD